MTKWRVSFELVLNDGHPRKWIPETIYESLEEGESVDNFVYEALDEVDEETNND